MLETAIGVFGGLLLFSLFNSLLEVPKRIQAQRRKREFLDAMREVTEHMINEGLKAKKEIENAEKAKQSRKGTAKTAGSRTSKAGTRSQAGRRSASTNRPVRSGRKGTSKKVSN